MTLRTELLSETLFSLWIEAWNQPTMEQQQTLRALRSDDAHHSTWSPAHLSDYYSLTFQQPADSPAPSPPPAISRWWTFKTGSILTASNADFHSALISCSIPKGSVLESSPLQHVHGPIWSWSPDNMTSVSKMPARSCSLRSATLALSLVPDWGSSTFFHLRTIFKLQ